MKQAISFLETALQNLAFWVHQLTSAAHIFGHLYCQWCSTTISIANEDLIIPLSYFDWLNTLQSIHCVIVKFLVNMKFFFVFNGLTAATLNTYIEILRRPIC